MNIVQIEDALLAPCMDAVIAVTERYQFLEIHRGARVTRGVLLAVGHGGAQARVAVDPCGARAPVRGTRGISFRAFQRG